MEPSTRHNRNLDQTTLKRAGIFTHFCSRSLKLNRTRTVVSIIGIALSCALITAIFTSVETLYSGLLKAEIMNGGRWQVELAGGPAVERARLTDDPRVDEVYVREIYGSALMPQSFESYHGRYLDLQRWPTDDLVHGLLALPHIAEGRAPKAAGEIVLPRELKDMTAANGPQLFRSLTASGKDDAAPRVDWDGGLQVGTSMHIATGQRTHIDPQTGWEAPCPYDEELHIDTRRQEDVIFEYLAGVGEVRPYTVVGFYTPGGTQLHSAYDQWHGSGAAYPGFVLDDALPVQSSGVYLTTHLRSQAEIDQLVSDYTDLGHEPADSGADAGERYGAVSHLHESLLRYQGIHDERSLWGTLYVMAGILTTVVIAASVSLIYNSFAISVSERTRQFGLLASLGASKRQLRRTIYIEALLLSAIGIPIGLLLGLGGTCAVFKVTGEGIGALIDREAFAGAGLSSITVHPHILALAALIALLTVLISAALPAWRAGRVSVIDAIRQSMDIRPSRRERGGRKHGGKALEGRMRTGALDRLRLRFFAVPGLLAHRNLTRSSAKGRVAVASLAMSVALIIISGGFSHYLGLLNTISDDGGGDIEITLDRSVADGETTAESIDAIEGLYQDLGRVPGASAEGWVLRSELFGTFEPGMIDRDELFEEDDAHDIPERSVAEDGTIYSPISILFLDEQTWRSMLKMNGIDHGGMVESKEPIAVGINNLQSDDGQRYLIRDLFLHGGTATLFTQVDSAGDDYLASFGMTGAGRPVARYNGYGDAADQTLDTGGEAMYTSYERPLAEVLLDTYDLPIGPIVDTYPPIVHAHAPAWPTLALPVSALPALAASSEGRAFNPANGELAAPFAFHAREGASNKPLYVFLTYGADDPIAVERGMDEVFALNLTGQELNDMHLWNNAASAQSMRLVNETVRLFINCFVAVTGLIAVSNVFNTLTNSIILRRREFAMLKSVGMGKRSFWRMIALECLSYAWRGLVGGLALGTMCTFLIYRAIMISFTGVAFVVPFGWVIAAIGVVVCVLALSTLYALRKSDAGSIVQTLREDAI